MKQGLSLIEVLFVMAVLAVITAIAIPAYKTMEQEAIEASVKSDFHNAKIKLEAHSVMNN